MPFFAEAVRSLAEAVRSLAEAAPPSRVDVHRSSGALGITHRTMSVSLDMLERRVPDLRTRICTAQSNEGEK
ncbi:MAG: hypothetical protein ACTIID_06175 [Brevibacterium linens]|uniref:hypothetical protein n=1 Tax=Brevibacterium linens TaxID=1703 RepID=UPI003F9D21D2